MNIHDTIPNDMLLGDSDIVELHHNSSGRGDISELQLVNVLKRYNLKSGLIALGQVSFRLFDQDDENKIGRSGYREPNTGVFITQFSIAYLANILIISGSNDFKAKHITNKQNFLILNNLYSNSLIQPELDPNYGKMDKDKFISMMVRMWTEQMADYQFVVMNAIARSIFL